MSTKVEIILYKNGEVVQNIKKIAKTRVFDSVRRDIPKEWDFGEVKVTYNYRKDYWNKAYFTTLEELKNHVSSKEMLDPFLAEHFS